MIDHDLKCIFIHLPRTAGASISTAISQRKKEGEKEEGRERSGKTERRGGEEKEGRKRKD